MSGSTATERDVLDRLEAGRIVPVVVLDDAGAATDVAAALLEGGITCIEITLRTGAGLASIAAAAAVDGMTLGAGTVYTPGQVDQCVDAGAEFIVSPGYDDDVVARCQELGVVALPGVATATELQRAQKTGLSEVKFFPAGQLGGLSTIIALSQPFPSMRFMPSGGVNTANAAEYLGHPSVFALGGSWMVPRDAVRLGDFETVSRLSREAMALGRT